MRRLRASASAALRAVSSRKLAVNDAALAAAAALRRCCISFHLHHISQQHVITACRLHAVGRRVPFLLVTHRRFAQASSSSTAGPPKAPASSRRNSIVQGREQRDTTECDLTTPLRLPASYRLM